jgi:hypothetical protein
VLLVGDGNYDPKDNQGFGEMSYIPPYLDWVDNAMGESAADNYYVAVSGDGILPDMHLGRFPVKTAEEAQYLVQQTINYETNPPEDDWNHNVLFAADNYDPLAGNFAELSDVIADNFTPAGYTATKVYQNPPPPGYTGDLANFSDIEPARQNVKDNINQGALIVSYIGHANQLLWADWGTDLFQRDYIPDLINAGRLSFFVPMTCLDGYYIAPSSTAFDASSTAEAVVRAVDKGAVASFSASGMGVASGHDLLEKGLFDAIFKDHIIQLGRAATLSKLYMHAESGGGYIDLVKDYIFFGDPFTMLQVPFLPDLEVTMQLLTNGDILPGDTITYQVTFSNQGNALARNVVLTLDLDPTLQSPAFETTGAAAVLRAGSQYVWDVEDLPPGASGQVNVTAKVPLNFSGVLQNAASISYGALERDNADNQSTANTVVGSFPESLYFPAIYQTLE